MWCCSNAITVTCTVVVRREREREGEKGKVSERRVREG
jgi:hypothetical protein